MDTPNPAIVAAAAQHALDLIERQRRSSAVTPRETPVVRPALPAIPPVPVKTEPRPESARTLALIDELTRELARLRASVAVGAPTALSKIEEDLRGHPGASRTEVALRTGLTPKAVSKVLARAEERGAALRTGASVNTRWYLVQALRDAAHRKS